MESKLCFVVRRNFKQLFSNTSTEAQLKNFNSLFLFIVLFYLFFPLSHTFDNLKCCVCRFLCTNFFFYVSPLAGFFLGGNYHPPPVISNGLSPTSRPCHIKEGERQVITQARSECCFSRSGDNPSPTRAQREVNYMHAVRFHL